MFLSAGSLPLPLERIPGQGDKEAVKFPRFFFGGAKHGGENGMLLKGQGVRKIEERGSSFDLRFLLRMSF